MSEMNTGFSNCFIEMLIVLSPYGFILPMFFTLEPVFLFKNRHHPGTAWVLIVQQ